MHSLSLSAKAGNWRLYAARKGDKAFRAVQEKIFQRDNYTCQFCGFQAKDYQEVVNLDQDYHHNKVENLITSCCFCAQCLFLDAVGMDEYGGGTLIFLPELTQAELNSFCHVLFCAMANGTSYKSSAQAVYRSLKFRSQQVEKVFGEGSSEPANLGQLLLNAGASGMSLNDEVLTDLRLLPSRAKFARQIEHWAAAALAELEAEQQK